MKSRIQGNEKHSLEKGSTKAKIDSLVEKKKYGEIDEPQWYGFPPSLAWLVLISSGGRLFFSFLVVSCKAGINASQLSSLKARAGLEPEANTYGSKCRKNILIKTQHSFLLRLERGERCQQAFPKGPHRKYLRLCGHIPFLWPLFSSAL